jgi:hypothetical protein
MPETPHIDIRYGIGTGAIFGAIVATGLLVYDFFFGGAPAGMSSLEAYIGWTLTMVSVALFVFFIGILSLASLHFKPNLLDDISEEIFQEEQVDITEVLLRLGELRDKGILTDEEFEEQKKKLMES